MPYRPPIGIKLKITLAFSTVFILLSLLFNLFGYQRIRQMLIEDSDSYLLSRAGTLLEKTEINPAIIPLPDKNSFIRVLNRTNGKPGILFESPGILHRIPTPSFPGVTDTLGMRVAYVRSTSEDNPAELVLAVSNTPLEDNLRLLLSMLFTSTLICALISALVSYLLARVLLLPLQRIIHAAGNISANKIRDPIPVTGAKDELHELSVAINGMMQRIDESLQQQQNFFASASHELKTPLAILRTELEVSLHRSGLDDALRQLLGNQLEEIMRLQTVVSEFLVVSQLRASSPSIYRKPFDLSVLVIKVFNQLLPLLANKNLTPDIQFEEDAVDIMLAADEDKLRIVLLNLLENAAKYGVPGTTVTCGISRSANPDEVILLFTNHTIAREVNTDNLHTAFYRSDPMEKGAGLGLWLAREIIGLHGGQIHIDSADHLFQVKICVPGVCI